MKPWKLRIDWLCWNHRDRPAYADAQVEVWLDVMGCEPILLREFSSPQRAVDWALRYMTDRGVQPKLAHLPDKDPGLIYLHAGPPLVR